MVAPGAPPSALWEAATRLLVDQASYHAASAAAPAQVQDHTPAASAAAFIAAVA